MADGGGRRAPLTDDEREALAAALDAQVPGAAALGAVDHVEQLRTALDHDPPRIWAAPGPWAEEADPANLGRVCGPTASTRTRFEGPAWLELGPWERQAWAERIAELDALVRRVVDGAPEPGDERALHVLACEATYGDPAYGGNRDGAGWAAIGFPEPLFPPARVVRPGRPAHVDLPSRTVDR